MQRRSKEERILWQAKLVKSSIVLFVVRLSWLKAIAFSARSATTRTAATPLSAAADLNMRAKLADLGGMSYGELSIWEKTHGMEFAAWEHEWEKLNSGTQADGLKFPKHLPEGFPTRKAPAAHPWVDVANRAHEIHSAHV